MNTGFRDVCLALLSFEAGVLIWSGLSGLRLEQTRDGDGHQPAPSLRLQTTHTPRAHVTAQLCAAAAPPGCSS